MTTSKTNKAVIKKAAEEIAQDQLSRLVMGEVRRLAKEQKAEITKAVSKVLSDPKYLRTEIESLQDDGELYFLESITLKERKELLRSLLKKMLKPEFAALIE